MPSISARCLAETDLYPPLYHYLVAQGYTVRSEVNYCDITAARGDDLIVIELKRSFSIELLIQATRRQRITDSVYVALPRPRPSRRWNGIRHLLRRLELGLILVSFRGKTPRLEVVFHPLPFDRKQRTQARRAVLTEIARRSADLNAAGSHRRKIVTAYREHAVHIACCLAELGPLSPRQLRALGAGPKAQSILYHDFYGWFDRIGRGQYALRPQGQAELAQYPSLVQHYRALLAGASAPAQHGDVSGPQLPDRRLGPLPHGLLPSAPRA
jgi:hypothetical protein